MGSCLSGDGYTEGAEILLQKRRQALLIKSITPVVAAVDAANNAIDIANQTHEIADRKMKLAEEQLEFNKLAWPCEQDAINEINLEKPYEPIYETVVGRSYAPIKSEYALLKKQTRRAYNRYNTGALSAQMVKLCAAENVSIGLAASNAWRTEREKFDAYNDRRWNRLAQLSSLGKNISTQVTNLYTAAGSGLAGAARAAGNQFNDALGAFQRAYNSTMLGNPYVSDRFINAEKDPNANVVSKSALYSDEMYGGVTTLNEAAGGGLSSDAVSLENSNSVSDMTVGNGAIYPETGMGYTDNNSNAGNTVFNQDYSNIPDSTIRRLPEKTFPVVYGSVTVSYSQKEIEYMDANDPDLEKTDERGYQ